MPEIPSDEIVPEALPVPPGAADGDTSHAALMAALEDDDRSRALLAKTSYIARTRYGIRAQDAQDIFHESVATYLTIHTRYPEDENHFGILVGIFHRKSLEFLGAVKRSGRVAERLAAKLRADRPTVARGEDPEGAAADAVIRAEDAKLIRDAINSLQPDSRAMLLALADGECSRLEMIESLGINRNTFDTRLRVLRLRLKRMLGANGVM